MKLFLFIVGLLAFFPCVFLPLLMWITRQPVEGDGDNLDGQYDPYCSACGSYSPDGDCNCWMDAEKEQFYADVNQRQLDEEAALRIEAEDDAIARLVGLSDDETMGLKPDDYR